jgi:hypothetical protein
VSWFDDTFREAAVPVLMGYLSDPATVTYTAANGDQTELRAIITNQGADDQLDPAGRRVRKAREIIVTTDPDSEWGGLVKTDTKATVLLDGVVYAVEAVESHSESLIRLQLVQLHLKERTRTGFRRE